MKMKAAKYGGGGECHGLMCPLISCISMSLSSLWYVIIQMMFSVGIWSGRYVMSVNIIVICIYLMCNISSEKLSVSPTSDPSYSNVSSSIITYSGISVSQFMFNTICLYSILMRKGEMRKYDPSEKREALYICVNEREKWKAQWRYSSNVRKPFNMSKRHEGVI